MTEFDLTGKDICTVLLGGRMGQKGTMTTRYREDMEIYGDSYRVLGVFANSDGVHYWEPLNMESSLVNQLDNLAYEAGVTGIGFIYIGASIDCSLNKDTAASVFRAWLEESGW